MPRRQSRSRGEWGFNEQCQKAFHQVREHSFNSLLYGPLSLFPHESRQSVVHHPHSASLDIGQVALSRCLLCSFKDNPW